jgi:nucleotide-binding universal stress UspA family protein
MKILVAYDGSIGGDAAIEDMRRAGLPQNAEALVICDAGGRLPSPPGQLGPNDTWKAKLDIAEDHAETASNRIQSYFPGWKLSSETLRGSPAENILNTSGWWRPNLVIVGRSDRSRVARVFIGSVSPEVVHQARCSVRVARSGISPGEGPIRLVIGTDGSMEAGEVTREVARRSWPTNTEARVISAVETLTRAELEAISYSALLRENDEQERDRLQKATEDSTNSLRRAGLIANGTVVDGDPRQELVREAERWNADAIFVGARGLGGMERFLLGSVSTAVVTRARCTVEVVRQMQ